MKHEEEAHVVYLLEVGSGDERLDTLDALLSTEERAILSENERERDRLAEGFFESEPEARKLAEAALPWWRDDRERV